jgi:hypothetical protein
MTPIRSRSEIAATGDTIPVHDVKSWLSPAGDLTKYGLSVPSLRPMKFTRARTFSHFLLILFCGWTAMIFASIAAAGSPSWVQLTPTNSPPARSYLAMAYDPVSGKVIMFGGDNGTTYLNDTWVFDGVTWTEVTVNTPPPARAAAQMAYDSVTQKIVLFGGFDGRNYLGDTWLWDGTTSQ